MSGAPIPWTDSFASGSANSGQMSLNERSQSLPVWDAPNMSQSLLSNTGDFDFAQGSQLAEGLASQFSTYPPVSRSLNAVSQGDANLLWDSNIYSQPMRPMRGPSEPTNIDNMIVGGEEAGFEVHTSLSTNQLCPPTFNFTSQGRSQSLPYTGYTSSGCME
ncbi:hypothetical protein FSPOR_8570 [Fusarium sporotrichioides]|uniref:Uncharacterized protein n=1 Tax=Fusarium sporotrichioides TaxID=5514 RepID=A0A395RTW9_FUSSP|nr:hypothetical protein FSPOR_8570 [Fusarium sporotrichioides]